MAVMNRGVAFVRAVWLQVVISAAVGAGVVSVIRIGAGGWPSLRLVASGTVIGISIWGCCSLLAHVAWNRLQPLPRPLRLAGFATVFVFGGACGWLVAYAANLWLLGVRYSSSPGSVAISLVITCTLALAVGAAITTVEVLRDRLERSVEELKAKEYAERELEMAASIQRRLLPPEELELRGLRVCARHLPARYVAGDFYDVFRTADGRIAVAVADVVGKGMGASLIMASVKAALPLVGAGLPVADTLRELNRRLVAELGPREFVALALLHLDPVTGDAELGNAGLPDPYLVTAAPSPASLTVPGPRLPLGIRPEVRYETAGFALAPGSQVLMLTDGAPEARRHDGAPLGYTRFAELVASATRDDGVDLDRLIAAVRDATAPEPDDDWTLVSVARGPDVVTPRRTRAPAP